MPSRYYTPEEWAKLTPEERGRWNAELKAEMAQKKASQPTPFGFLTGMFGGNGTADAFKPTEDPRFVGTFQRGQEAAYGSLGQAQDVYGQQSALAQALRDQAEGKGPSLAQMQLERAMEQSQAAAQSQAASARGLSPAQAQQLALRQQAGSRAAMAGQSAQMRLIEQAQKQQQLASLLAQQRQGSLSAAEIAGGLGQTGGTLGLKAEDQEAARRAKQQEIEAAQNAGILGAVGSVASAAIPLLLARGSEVPGRAQYDGDTRANDTVPAMLSPGEIVLPRSVAQDSDAPDKAREFVAQLKARKKSTPKDFASALMRLRELESRMDALESLSDLEAEGEDD